MQLSTGESSKLFCSYFSKIPCIFKVFIACFVWTLKSVFRYLWLVMTSKTFFKYLARESTLFSYRYSWGGNAETKARIYTQDSAGLIAQHDHPLSENKNPSFPLPFLHLLSPPFCFLPFPFPCSFLPSLSFSYSVCFSLLSLFLVFFPLLFLRPLFFLSTPVLLSPV